MKTALCLALLLALAALASADTYMHSPRGMNNRCDEQNNDRNNNNRIFNSQNNAAGGYAVAPPLYYHAGSILTLEWYSQHSCGPYGTTGCEIIWQYSCNDDAVTGYKDGTSNDPTGDNGGNTCTDEVTTANEAQTNVGRHESANYFTDCNARNRNANLFAAAETVTDTAGAQATRQNPGGNTSGFECQEERDYYPYWHPTPFVDIAVLTTNTSRCDYYQAQSENILGRFYCTAPTYNNEADCVANAGTWDQANSHKRKAPICESAQWSRDNHLGSGQDGYMNNFNWTVPLDVSGACFLRLRYNVTSGDYDAWNIDAGRNGQASPVQDDPFVDYGDMPVRLAIDTNQFGRTFEDRSYVFEIKASRIRGVATNLYNLAVRGKRGNIAQVRNCVEYDFTPQRLRLSVGDYIHPQWTGSNHNPNGNAGEGRNRWDRSNMVQLIANDLSANYPEPIKTQKLWYNQDLAYRAAFIDQAPAGGCADQATIQNDDQSLNNCARLNGNPTGYFDLGIQRINQSGIFNYMSTRNNNFTNRSQKGTLVISAFGRGALILVLIIAAIAGAGFAGAGVYYVSQKRGGFGSLKNRSSFGSRGSGHGSHGSHRSKNSKSSFGGSMI